MRDGTILPTPERLREEPALTSADICWGFDGAPEMAHTDVWLAQAAKEAVANYHAEQLGKRVRAGQRRNVLQWRPRASTTA